MERFRSCPLCGGIVDEGHLSAGGYRIIWTEDVRRFSALPSGNDHLVEQLSLTGKLHNTALRCRKCGTIFITEYKERSK